MKKILIIEDSPVFADIVSSYIKEEIGAEFKVVMTRKDAVSELSQSRDDYFLAIVDLHLPDAMNGEVVEDTANFGIPAIVLTGDINSSLREDILSYVNVADYVLKNGPNALEYVAQTIKRLNMNQSTHVLVVDDSRLSRQLLMKSLSTQLLNIATVNSAEFALEYLKAHPEVQLVITDGELEGMNGIELTTEIRRFRGLRELAVIGISGAYSKGKSIEFLKAGANDFLGKPFQFEELNTRVNHNLNTINQMAELKSATDNQQMLLNMAAHDIRNPLGNIVSLAELSKGDPASSAKYLELISTSGNELLALVEGIVEFSRLKSSSLDLELEKHKAQELIGGILPELQQIAENKQIKVNFESNNTVLKADATLLSQVLKNLINNAIKFSPKNTVISVTCLQEEDAWWVRVSDQGQGIPVEERNQLFKEFCSISTKPTAQESSTGLGLALCKQLIDAHKGEIGVEDNDSGVGITFFVKLRT